MEPTYDVWLALPRFKDMQPHTRIAQAITADGIRYLKAVLLMPIHVELSRKDSGQ